MQSAKDLCAEIIEKIKSMANPRNVEGMARFGINSKNTYGVQVFKLRAIAKEAGKNHELAQLLWDSQIHEARIIAAYVEDPKIVTEAQMEKWALDFDSWDVCDQVCSNLFDRTEFAWKKAFEWSGRKEEFVKRAGFVIMAVLASHDKKAPDSKFVELLPIIKRESCDERNYVRKAVNWALRGIGKRNMDLNKAAIAMAKDIAKIDSKTAHWIAADAIRELEAQKTIERICRKNK
ncbi:MAG: DNA alkylation repair protein [Candidatus Thermoplasmatota archaeon]|nr:DNA alkylation repair protein [Candidatus Thermoplasmatota archaeon]